MESKISGMKKQAKKMGMLGKAKTMMTPKEMKKKMVGMSMMMKDMAGMMGK